MSCEDCEKAQDEEVFTYYRWKNANVELRGCDTHLREVLDALNVAQGIAPRSPTRPIFKVRQPR